MLHLSSTQKKVLDLYHNEGTEKAWNYWKLMGNTYGIFLGVVPSNDFINGGALAKHIGLSEGVLCNIDTPWLKFLLDGNIIYVPMKPLMHTASWNAINGCGAVYENEGASIIIGNNEYDITLLRGANIDMGLHYNGYDVAFTHNSEWNRLMYPIHSGIHTDSSNPSNPSVPFNEWASYSDVDLIVRYHGGSGSYSWTQETPDNDTSERNVRGGSGVTYVLSLAATDAFSSIGWRPALRLL